CGGGGGGGANVAGAPGRGLPPGGGPRGGSPPPPAARPTLALTNQLRFLEIPMSRAALRRMATVVFVALVALPAGRNRSSACGETSTFPKDGPKIPLGLVPIFWPKDNPYTPQKAELGWLLYFDKRMSADQSVACSSCHDPKFAFTDGQRFSKGIRGQLGGRSAPTVINRAYSLDQFWDGRAKSLEEQAKGPIENPVEMGHPHELCEK